MNSTSTSEGRRARRTAVIGGAAAASMVAVAAGAWAISRSGAPSQEGKNAQNNVEWLACARLILRGHADKVEPAGHERVLVTFSVDAWLKPSGGSSRVTVSVVDPRARGLEPIATGVPTLLVVPTNASLPADVSTGAAVEDAARLVHHYLPAARTATCPSYWRTRDGSTRN